MPTPTTPEGAPVPDMPGWTPKRLPYTAPSGAYHARSWAEPRCTAYSHTSWCDWCFYGPEAEANAKAFAQLWPDAVIKDGPRPGRHDTASAPMFVVTTDGPVLR
jgi:hypothetical protein